MYYSLWRQDDNGNRFPVGDFPDRSAAEARLAELTRSLHKQAYWISETGTESREVQPPHERPPHYPDKDPS
jgi:hypothetical protein